MAGEIELSQYYKALRLRPDVGDLAYSLVYWMRYFGAVVRVSEGVRSGARQRELYAKGRTAPGPIVTKVKVSKHQLGRAFDIDFVGYHPDAVPREWWDFAGYVGEALGLTWGGRWSFRDYRHFEL